MCQTLTVIESGGFGMTIIKAIFLGLIHGITEILPVGSQGHIIIFNKIFNNSKIELCYDIMLHIAILVAIIIAFREDMVNMVMEFADMCKRIFANSLIFIAKKRGDTKHKYVKVIDSSYKKLLIMVFISFVPTMLLVILGQGIAKLCSGAIWIVGICFIINGIMLFLMDRHPESLDRIKDVPYSSGILVGMAQGVSVVPGISRTAATISMGVFLGFNKKLAVKYSFIMSVPAIIGQIIYKLIIAEGKGLTLSLLPGYIIGMIIAGVVGFFAIKIMLKLILRKKYLGFAIYCGVIGIVAILLSLL